MALKIFGEFEIEHLMAQALFGVSDIGAFLNGMGITKDMRGNKIALYANADHVAQILDGPEELSKRRVGGSALFARVRPPLFGKLINFGKPINLRCKLNRQRALGWVKPRPFPGKH